MKRRLMLAIEEDEELDTVEAKVLKCIKVGQVEVPGAKGAWGQGVSKQGRGPASKRLKQ